MSLEKTTNERLREYVRLYFGDAHTNAYYFETTDSGFGSVWLVKNEESGNNGSEIAQWDSIHSFTVETAGGKTTYTLVSTIFLHVKFSGEVYGRVQIAGTSTRKAEEVLDEPSEAREHIERMG